MPKRLALWFAFSSIILLTITSITLSSNGWISLICAVLAFFNVGFGFMFKAKYRKKAEQEAALTAKQAEPSQATE
ncbi:hypothetical protein NQ117_20490 [Paenibacillus sp. SC116]|uniref:hypothetical protein n=1 Tax=Paenibacillus sp. SC116 TaxID=2968986 RepID=UPI00215ABDFC|nr:hypothetical protein [Paenibacillus sp. SC116]MCR8846063.1 hypothetical protein [Paenibacillus sp. SC116]